MQTSSTKIGGWEIHTKGFGSKILRKFGWEEGKSIGKNSHGLIEPLNFEANCQFDGNQVKVIKKPKSYNDERKIHLINELDKLMLDSDNEDEKPKNKISTVIKPIRPYRLGSSSGPIVWL